MLELSQGACVFYSQEDARLSSSHDVFGAKQTFPSEPRLYPLSVLSAGSYRDFRVFGGTRVYVTLLYYVAIMLRGIV